MAKFGGDTGIDADYEQAAADNMIHTGRRDCSCNKCRPSFDSKLADENCISIKDINKEIAKDYKYEHDQINEKSRTMEDILIDLITVHYNHDKLMSVNDFDSYCILAEETYNQENGEV